MTSDKLKFSDREIMDKLGIDVRTLEMFKKVRQEAMKEVLVLNRKKKGKIKVLGISGSARDKHDMAQEWSNSEELLMKALEFCKKWGADTEIISLRKYDIKPCKACYSSANTQCHYPCSCYSKSMNSEDDMTRVLYDKIYGADAIIFATPVNNFSMSSYMKLFIDRCISLDGSLKPANPRSPKDRELNIKQMKFIEMTADNDIPGGGMLRRFPGKVAGIIATGHEEGASLAMASLYMTLTHYGMAFPPFSNVYAMSSVCNSTYEDKPLVLSECYAADVELLAKNVMTMAKTMRNVKSTDWKNDYASN